MRGMRPKDAETKEFEKMKAKAAALGFSEWDARESRRTIADEFGLCGRCEYMNLAKSGDAVRHAKCDIFSIRLRVEHPITECTGFFRRGHPSLEDMWQNAVMINPPKDPLGFQGG
jgi:hypothetical protein